MATDIILPAVLEQNDFCFFTKHVLLRTHYLPEKCILQSSETEQS